MQIKTDINNFILDFILSIERDDIPTIAKVLGFTVFEDIVRERRQQKDSWTYSQWFHAQKWFFDTNEKTINGGVKS